MAARLKALWHAVGIRRYILGSAILAIIAASDFILEQARSREFTDWVGVPSWQIAVIVAFAAIFWWVLDALAVTEQRLIPSVLVDFRPLREGIAKIQSTPGQTWIRGSVIGVSEVEAQNCRVYLVAVEYRADAARAWEPTDYDEGLPLKWAHEDGEPTTDPVSIPKGAKRIFNIVAALERMRIGNPPADDLLEIADYHPKNLAGLFERHGHYRLTVFVSASGLSSSLHVEVTWAGRARTMTAAKACFETAKPRI